MRPIVRLTSAAEQDLLEARGWYRDQVPGLDVRFRGAVREGLGRIAERPALYAKVHRDVRRALVHRFPYSIFYRMTGESVLVIAIVHQARDPKVWKRRR